MQKDQAINLQSKHVEECATMMSRDQSLQSRECIVDTTELKHQQSCTSIAISITLAIGITQLL